MGGADGVTWGEAGRPQEDPCGRGFWGPQPDSSGTQEGRRKKAIAIEPGEARWA